MPGINLIATHHQRGVFLII